MSTAGLTFHVVNRAAKRTPLFEFEHDYAAFERILVAAVNRIGVALFAYCLMPNHWHFVLSPRADGSLSRFMHWMTTTHARRWQLSRGLDGYGAVYQGRFKAIPIGGDRHFLWVCRYVERNALRAGLVKRAEHWRWSSLWRRTHEQPEWLAPWPCTAPDAWIPLVNAPQTREELERFRAMAAAGLPFGDDQWTASTMRQLGMPLRGKRGQPRKSVLKK